MTPRTGRVIGCRGCWSVQLRPGKYGTVFGDIYPYLNGQRDYKTKREAAAVVREWVKHGKRPKG